MTQNQNMTQNLKEHHASVTINAPVNQVYSLFTHFNDFPKFMSFVNEVTYYDEQHSHWVANVVGRHEWDAINEHWAENRQIGWRSYNGLENRGRVIFQTVGPMMTKVDVDVAYNPPAGVLGDVGEGLGAGSSFESSLQHDLENFARMVDQSPQGALDPTSSNYLFHDNSAAAKGNTTERQNATMQETVTNSGREINRPIMDKDIINDPSITGIDTPTNQTALGKSDEGTSYDPTRPANTPDPANRNALGRPDQGTSYDPTRPPVDTETPSGRNALGRRDEGTSYDPTRASESPDGQNWDS